MEHVISRDREDGTLKRIVYVMMVGLLVCGAVESRERSGKARLPQMPGAKSEVYRKVGDVELKIYIFSPDGHAQGDKKPASVFFFGGGWRSGSPTQFQAHCTYLASRGMVAMAADYRVLSRQGVKAVECVKDAKAAVRWIRANAKRLGVDPERIVAGGGSAGGHLAACVGVVPGFETGDHLGQSSVPNALALFNPAVVLASWNDGVIDPEKLAKLEERMGVAPQKLSPIHHVQEGAPPAVIFHGKADTTVPYATVEAFTAEMKKKGNECTLHGYEGQPHGFFNYRKNKTNFTKTVRALDEFLVELGYLKGGATVDGFTLQE